MELPREAGLPVGRTSPGRCRRVAILVPLLAGDRALLVGVGHDQAGIDREPLAADQASRDACLHHTLEHVPEDIAVPEALVPGARERRMARDLVLDAQAAELA